MMQGCRLFNTLKATNSYPKHCQRVLVSKKLFVSTALASLAFMQQASANDLASIMARLERLERENHKIIDENKRFSAENVELRERLKRVEKSISNGSGSASTDSSLKKEALNSTTQKYHDQIQKSWVSGSIEKSEIKNNSIKVNETRLWTGFYTGLNVGYGWGANKNAQTNTSSLYDNSVFGPAYPDGYLLSANPYLGASAIANTANLLMSQGGLIGGLEAGYNYELSSKIVIGFETDIQGSSIKDSASYSGKSVLENIFAQTPQGNNYNVNFTHVGSGSISANIDWLGTARGRLGYSIIPSLLIYGTGGFSYGNITASSANNFLYTAQVRNGDGSIYESNPWTGNSIGGSGSYSAVKLGWVAGGGIEWMFLSGWSTKAEAIYYNLGSASFNNTPIISSISAYRSSSSVNPIKDINISNSRVAFDGIIARAGINYHFISFNNSLGSKY